MANDLAINLRLVCSYTKSISHVCRRIGINRQQFHRYLSGDSEPSLGTLRKICDYFGLEDWEMLLDQVAFRRLVAIKRPVAGEFSEIAERVRDILMLSPASLERLREYTGYYYNYFCPIEYPGQILCGFLHVSEEGGFVFSRNIERYPQKPDRSTRKYNGLFVHSGERVLMFEREADLGKMVWLTVLYPSDRDQPALLPGLTIGVTSTANREIACYRVILQHLGQHVNVRQALGRCGLYDAHDPSIDAAIRSRVRNEMTANDTAFNVRL